MRQSSAAVPFVDDKHVDANARNERSDRWRSPWRVVTLGVLALGYTLAAFCTWTTSSSSSSAALPAAQPWLAAAGDVSFVLGAVAAAGAVGVAARTTLIRHLHPSEFIVFLFAGLWLLLVVGVVGLALVFGSSC